MLVVDAIVRRFLISAVFAAAPLAAAPVDAEVLTLDRIFASPALAGEQPRALAFSPDGRTITSLRPRADDKDRYDLWAMNAGGGGWRMLIDSKTIGDNTELSEAEKMQRERARIGGQRGIVAYHWSTDGKSILVPLDGKLYLATPTGKVQAVAGSQGALNPAVSPAGRYLSFVRERALFVAALDGGAAHRIVGGGEAATVHWGEAEFVAQEEMARSAGYWWSPDDRFIAVERFDEAPVGIVTRAAIGAGATRLFEQRYPVAGTPNVRVDLYVMRADGSGRVRVDLGDDGDIYLARATWAPDGSALYVQRENRAQTRLDVLKIDPSTGASTLLFSEQAGSKRWINLSDGFRPLRDGSFLWWSERDGHGHLYRYRPAARSKWQQLTRGDWDVADIVRVDEAGSRLFFSANKDDALERHLYAIDLDPRRASSPRRLTEGGWWNQATAADNADLFLINRSNPDQPPQVYLADAAGRRTAWVAQNAVAGSHPYLPFVAGHRSPRFGTIPAADGTILHWRMLTPALVPGRKYPVFFEHYGGPRAQVVTRGWTNPLHRLLVDKGYIVFQLDNRGSANRGLGFESAIWHALGKAEVADQLAGATFLKSSISSIPAGSSLTAGRSAAI